MDNSAFSQSYPTKTFDERINDLVYASERAIANLREEMLANRNNDEIQQIRNIFEKLNEKIDNCIIDSMVPLVLSSDSEFESTPLEDFIF